MLHHLFIQLKYDESVGLYQFCGKHLFEITQVLMFWQYPTQGFSSRVLATFPPGLAQPSSREGPLENDVDMSLTLGASSSTPGGLSLKNAFSA